MDLLDLHVHRLQKKKPAGPIAKSEAELKKYERNEVLLGKYEGGQRLRLL